jgi:hypothetical protein
MVFLDLAGPVAIFKKTITKLINTDLYEFDITATSDFSDNNKGRKNKSTALLLLRVYTSSIEYLVVSLLKCCFFMMAHILNSGILLLNLLTSLICFED